MAVTVYQPSVSTADSSLGYLLERLHVREALTALWPRLVHVAVAADGGPNSWLTIPVHKGKTVVFWRPPVPTANTTALAETADDPTPLSLSASIVSGTCSEYGEQMVVTDWSIDTLIVPAVEVAVQSMAAKAAISFDALIYHTVSANGTKKYVAGKTAANKVANTDTLTKAELEKLAFYLHANNVRPYPDGYYKYHCAPASLYNVRGEATAVVGWADWINRHAGGDEVRGWEVGTLCGFRIVETTQLKVISGAAMSGGTSASTDVWGYYNLWAGHESVGAVSLAGSNLPAPPKVTTPELKRMAQWKPENANIRIKVIPPGGAGQHDPLGRRGIVAYKFCTLVKVLDSVRCGVHLCGSKGSIGGNV